MRDDEADRVGYCKDLVCLRVWDLDRKLVLDSHDYLHGVQRVQAEVILEVCDVRYLGGVNLVYPE